MFVLLIWYSFYTSTHTQTIQNKNYPNLSLLPSDRLWILLPDCLLVCGTEVLVDWLKHAFITRFNDIPSDAYRDYTVLLASDLIMCKQKYVSVYSYRSPTVGK